ncbi:hypothetical protein COB57_01750 [Candidatus Peregrinibacteria bacterium]|nr:MAG: hypothetical protein COB57_01750 [Candidatus Peregrinibacteria bacterium]
MKTAASFPGFSKKLPMFFAQLEENNNRQWFEEHRSEYEELVKIPVQSFISAMEVPMLALRPYLYVDKRSVFRIYRDVRFSKNKAPYKPWLSLAFWEGAGKKTENPSFFIRIASQNILIGSGFYRFTKPMLDAFRKEITDEKGSKKFEKMVNSLKKKGFTLSGEHYKRYPRGFDENSPNSEFLKFNSLFMIQNKPIPKEIFTKDCIKHCVETFEQWTELHDWLVYLQAKS